MGNFLTFIQIYNETSLAAENGDYMLVIYELARLGRRIMDFKSMERENMLTIMGMGLDRVS